ncbi:MAG: hypothetical protein CMB67_02635 [Euryarchaeota archaeon]|nr:hypothetical protein [Euryarchaeota archaeon]|tara:strand:- start:983 stop:1597 length:615 start_codon:yes stop_codon:yes gene_type:complete
MVDLCCLIFLAIPLFFYWIQKRTISKMNDNHRHLAEQLKMGFNPDHGFDGTLMSGEIGEFKHRCRAYFQRTRSTGRKGRNYHLVITVSFLKPLSLGLEIKPQGFLYEGISFSAARQKDIQVGQSVFDSNFRISGFDDDKVRQFLDQGRMESIISLKETMAWYNSMLINDEGITTHLSGLIDDPNHIGGVMFQLADLASKIEKLS